MSGILQVKFAVLVITVLATLSSMTAAYAHPGDYVASVPVASTGKMTDPNLEAFVDRHIEENMAAAHVPGLAIVAVRDGQVVLSKGYGYASLEQAKPMTPQTPVRAGSLSKPVLAAVVSQLVEQDVIDSDAPVSRYITDLELQDEFGGASSVVQLMTHMGGYDDILLQTHAPSYDEWLPLGAYLRRNSFQRSMPPGKVISYSSYGYALLGYAAERAAGTGYDEIATRNLFAPLGMNMTTYAQPLPPTIAQSLATGYHYQGEEYLIVPHDFVKMSPAVALVTTADDMARFMLALLNGGELDGVRVMSEETAASLLTRQVGITPEIPGRSYAFWENNFAGRRVLTHEGNGIGFGNVIALAPDQHFGLYVVANHQVFDKGTAPSAAWNFLRSLRYDIVKEYLPEAERRSLGQALAKPETRAAEYAGHYQPTSFAKHDFFKLGALTDAFDVKGNGDGSVTFGHRRYIEVAPRVVQSVEDPELVWSFVEDDEGQIEYLTLGRGGTYRKVAWYENAMLHQALAALMLLASLSMVALWPFARHGHVVAVVISLVNLITLAGYAYLLFNGNIVTLFKTVPVGVRVLQVLPWLSAILSLGLIGFTVIMWRDRTTSFWARLHYSLVTIASVVFVWFANFWNLLLK